MRWAGKSPILSWAVALAADACALSVCTSEAEPALLWAMVEMLSMMQ